MVMASPVVGHEMVATLPRNRISCACQDRRVPQVRAGAVPGVHRRADQPDGTTHAPPAEAGVGGARGEGLARHGVAVSASRGAPVQKKHCSLLEQARADIARRGQRWQMQSSLDPRRLAFIDETCIKTNMAPLGLEFHPLVLSKKLV